MSKVNKSLNFGHYVPNDEILNKKVPENPKYRNVKPAIDTGKNVKWVIDELKERHNNMGYKKDEIFKRIKFASYLSLAVNFAKILLNPDIIIDIEEGVQNSDGIKKEENNEIPNVLIGIGEIDLRNEKKKPAAPLPKIEIQVPYLLLDVRDREDYILRHLRTARHYPSALISRSIGYEIEEMKEYKNSGDIIILYDDDESISPRVATTLVERGYENVFIIPGGLKKVAEIVPHKLMKLILTDKFPVSKMGGCGMVLMTTPSSENFTEEDIDKIEPYLEDFSIKNYKKPVLSSNTRSPLSKGIQSSSQKTAEQQNKQGSLTYRKDSAGSAKSTNRARITSGNVGEERSKSAKAPWK